MMPKSDWLQPVSVDLWTQAVANGHVQVLSLAMQIRHLLLHRFNTGTDVYCLTNITWHLPTLSNWQMTRPLQIGDCQKIPNP